MNDSQITGALVAAITVAAAAFAISLALPVLLLGGIVWYFHWSYTDSPHAIELKRKKEIDKWYNHVKALGQKWPDDIQFALTVLKKLPDMPLETKALVGEVATNLYDQPVLHEPPPIANSIEGSRYLEYIKYLAAYPDAEKHARIIAEAFTPFVHSLPKTQGTLEASVPVSGQLVEDIILPFYDGDGFQDLRSVLDRNLDEQTPKNASECVRPSMYKGENVVWDYLKDTPLLDLFKIKSTYKLPDPWEHCHIVGGSGHGKTTLLQHAILEGFKSNNSIVVIDSQSDLIPKLAHLKTDRKVIYLSPRDNPALNVFDINLGRFSDREQVFNQTLEVFRYLFNSLLGADLTVRQATMFNYIVHLMLTLPEAMGRNATLLDMMNVMENTEPYNDAIALLPPIPRRFFQYDFVEDTMYKQTRAQVRYRLQAILGNTVLARLFLAPENSIDFYEELQNGSIILIDTDKAYLQATNSGYFGKIALSLVLNAILARAAVSHKHPTLVYIDEAGEYFDKSIDTFLTECRKQKAGLTIAHQYLGQLPNELRASVASNTAIKLAGGVSTQDAKALAPDMRTTSDFIMEQKSLNFACYVKGQPTVSVHVPIGILDKEPQREDYEEWRASFKRPVTQPEEPDEPEDDDPENVEI